MWGEEGVGCHELVANCALDGGFDFAFRAGGDASLVSIDISHNLVEALLFFKHLGGLYGCCDVRASRGRGVKILGSRCVEMPRDLVATIDLVCRLMEG